MGKFEHESGAFKVPGQEVTPGYSEIIESVDLGPKIEFSSLSSAATKEARQNRLAYAKQLAIEVADADPELQSLLDSDKKYAEAVAQALDLAAIAQLRQMEAGNVSAAGAENVLKNVVLSQWKHEKLRFQKDVAQRKEQYKRAEEKKTGEQLAAVQAEIAEFPEQKKAA